MWCLKVNRYACILFRGDHIIFPRYSLLDIWSWKLKDKVMTKVKMDGYVWGPTFNWYLYFAFCGNRIIFPEIQQIQYLFYGPGRGDLKCGQKWKV